MVLVFLLFSYVGYIKIPVCKIRVLGYILYLTILIGQTYSISYKLKILQRCEDTDDNIMKNHSRSYIVYK